MGDIFWGSVLEIPDTYIFFFFFFFFFVNGRC